MTRVVGLPLSFDTREEADEIAGELRESLQGFRWKVRVVLGGGGRRPQTAADRVDAAVVGFRHAQDDESWRRVNRADPGMVRRHEVCYLR